MIRCRPPAKSREIILVLGKGGCGKTLWTRRHLAAQTRYLVTEWDQHEYRGVLITHRAALLAYLERFGHASFRICYDRVEDFPALCVYAQSLRNLTLVIEEADRPGLCGAPVDVELMELIARGRHYGVSLVAVSGRPTNLAVDLRARATRVIAFAQTEPDVLTWLRQSCGFDPSAIRALHPLEYYEWNLGTGVSRKIVLDPALCH